MGDFNFINTIIELAISIVCPVVVAYVTNRKATEESNFFSYIILAEENFVKKTKKRGIFFMIVLLAWYLVIGLNGTLYSLPIDENVLEKVRIVWSLVLFTIMIGQICCNFILAFSDIEYLDEKIRKKKRDFSDMYEWINLAITIVFIVGFGVVFLCRKNADAVSIILYSLVPIIIGMEMVYNSFISLYVKIRCWYYVEEIIIRTKTTPKVYRNIFNYRKNSKTCEFVCEEENILKRISVPVNEVELIEKKINIGKTYLDITRENKVNGVKKKNGKNGFWHDFVSQNKTIVMTGAIAVLYCIVCVFYKSSAKLNVNENIYAWGELLFNIAISVIAAMIFFIVQVFFPNRKKEQTLKKYAKKYLNEIILYEYNLLKIRTEMIFNGEKSEDEMKAAINSNCINIREGIKECERKYFQILPEELIDAMNSVLFDNMFYMISIRANNTLVNRSLEDILSDQRSRQFLWERFESIKTESEKL